MDRQAGRTNNQQKLDRDREVRELFPVRRVAPLRRNAPLEEAAAKEVNIVVISDAVEALVKDTADKCTYMFDNNKSGGSQNFGTNHLDSHVKPGDTVRWYISGLEVETLLDIKAITGPGQKVCNAQRVEGIFGPFWQGTVGTETGKFQYKLELQIESKVMTLSSAPTLTIS